MTLRKQPYGRLADGTAVEKYTLATARGVTAELISYGGILTSLTMPDRRGRDRQRDPRLRRAGELHRPAPPTSARCSGAAPTGSPGAPSPSRAGATAWPATTGPTTCTGASRGFDKAVWKARPFRKADTAGLVLRHLSKDGDEGYPGSLQVETTVSLSEAGQLGFQFSARSRPADPREPEPAQLLEPGRLRHDPGSRAASWTAPSTCPWTRP